MMRRLPLALFVCGILAVPLIRPSFAQNLSGSSSGATDEYQGQEHIADFSETAAIAPDRTVSFEERINYDFADLERHGIYRYIPVSYDRNGATYKLRLNVTKVQRDGNDEKYDESTSEGNLNLKIGDADVLITGAHAYSIAYNTNRAINFFPDHDELYWNVTGDGWEVPIEQSSFTLTLPAGIDMGSVTTTCFTGVYGSTAHDCTVKEDAGKLVFKTTRVLEAYEGFTIVVGMPKGVIVEPTLQDKFWMIVQDNGVLFLPVAAFLIMFGLWWTRGRDPKKGTVIPEYEPPEKLSPALVGAAMTDGTVPPRTVTATIIDLARRGYLKIRFGEKKGLLSTTQTYTFVKKNEADDRVTDYEGSLLEGLFEEGDEQTIDDLKTSLFYTNVSSFKKKVQSKIDGMKLFDASPMVRGAYVSVAVLLGWVLLFFFASTNLGFVAAIATGLIVAVFGWFMPRRNERGVKLLTDIEGFKWFLSVTEKDRLEFHNAPQRTPDQFMEFLPYAIVFEVENKWAQQFASLNLPPPQWAEGTSISSWNTAMFVSNLSSMHSAASSSAYASPSSSGSGGSGFSGGGSGGGGGGGGGGSW